MWKRKTNVNPHTAHGIRNHIYAKLPTCSNITIKVGRWDRKTILYYVKMVLTGFSRSSGLVLQNMNRRLQPSSQYKSVNVNGT